MPSVVWTTLSAEFLVVVDDETPCPSYLSWSVGTFFTSSLLIVWLKDDCELILISSCAKIFEGAAAVYYDVSGKAEASVYKPGYSWDIVRNWGCEEMDSLWDSVRLPWIELER